MDCTTTTAAQQRPSPSPHSPAAMATQMKLEFNAKERVLLALTLLLAPIFVCEVYGVAAMRTRAAFRDASTAARMPQFRDLPIGLGIALVIVALRFVLAKLFQPIGYVVLAPHKRTTERVERFATVLFKFLYFMGITAAGYAIMKDEAWFPTSLGGRGDVVESFRVIDTPPSPALKLYFLVQLGYHTHSLLYMLLLTPIRNDFLEMLLHHVATIFLIGSSFLANYTANGALVTFLHDTGDIAAYAIKSVVDTGNTPLTVTMYLVLLATWGYTRLWVFPRDLIYNAVVVLPQVNPEVSMVFLHPINAMLCMLQLLHIYWYVLFLFMGYMLLKTGKQEDIQQVIPDKNEKIKKNKSQ